MSNTKRYILLQVQLWGSNFENKIKQFNYQPNNQPITNPKIDSYNYKVPSVIWHYEKYMTRVIALVLHFY